jgi:hypothetical protein
MKRVMLLLFMTSMLFAIKQVPRQTGTHNANNSEFKIETNQEAKTQKNGVVQKREREQDRFIDRNSNGVNDRREDDFQNIKTKKSKHKELLDKKDDDRGSKKQKVERQQKPKASNKTSERSKTSSKGKKKEK